MKAVLHTSSLRKEKRDGNILVFLSVVFVIGIVVGSYVVKFVPAEELKEVNLIFEDFANIANKEKLSLSALFFAMFTSGVKYLSLIFLAGFTILSPVFVVLMIGYRGFAMGFASACILSSVGSNTFATLTANVLLHNMLIFPIVVFFGGESVRFAFQMIEQIKNKGNSRRHFEQELLIFFVKFIACVICVSVLCLFAALLMPLFYRFI